MPIVKTSKNKDKKVPNVFALTDPTRAHIKMADDIERNKEDKPVKIIAIVFWTLA